MAYTVKLKNQTGSEVIYSAIETLAVPMSSGVGDAYFIARYNVEHTASASVEYDGGKYAAHGVDYVCRISASIGTIPTSITVTIGGTAKTCDVDYTYSQAEGLVIIKGSCITGDIVITA